MISLEIDNKRKIHVKLKNENIGIMSKSLDMNGSYSFDSDTVKSEVSINKIGNYALGYTKNSTFYPQYVGRSDTDLQDELIIRLVTHPHSRFKFSYANSKGEAYRKECQNYHDFKVPENDIHPALPRGMNLTCPICGK
jgi:hypothetical protein